MFLKKITKNCQKFPLKQEFFDDLTAHHFLADLLISYMLDYKSAHTEKDNTLIFFFNLYMKNVNEIYVLLNRLVYEFPKKN